jgi:hypothetical protein
VYPKETRYVTSPQVSASRVTRSALITLCHEKVPPDLTWGEKFLGRGQRRLSIAGTRFDVRVCAGQRPDGCMVTMAGGPEPEGQLAPAG